MLRAAAIIFVMVFPLQNSVRAQGLFDFLDPCIGAKDAYWNEHGSITQNYNFQIEAINSEQPTNRFRQWWWEEKKPPWHHISIERLHPF
jgi:hypothetical protein